MTLKPFSLDSLVRVATTDQTVKIVSAPMIVTTHNKKAVIKVVDNVPYAKSSITGTSTAANNTFQVGAEYIDDVGIVLEVTPLIGQNGLIQMDIKQIVKSIKTFLTIGQNGAAQSQAPQISNREATSFVSVNDDEVFVLAGLQQRNKSDSKGKVFILGDIPIFGRLFNPTTKADANTELVMFIRPRIVRGMEGARELKDELMNASSAEDDIKNYQESGRFDKRNCQTEERKVVSKEATSNWR